MVAHEIKDIIYSLGADICGIANVERFDKAPIGFRPKDIYPKCKSVIVYAKRLPSESIYSTSCIPYTHINSMLINELDIITLRAAESLEKKDIGAVVIPSDDPYEYWENENQYGRAILSLRHAGYLAGLGVIGKNTLLINEELGNMIQIGALLCNLDLEVDNITNYHACPSDCHLCIENCPAKALDGKTVNQKRCRPLSNFKHEKGYSLKKCCICRRICPSMNGIRKNSA